MHLWYGIGPGLHMHAEPSCNNCSPTRALFAELAVLCWPVGLQFLPLENLAILHIRSAVHRNGRIGGESPLTSWKFYYSLTPWL